MQDRKPGDADNVISIKAARERAARDQAAREQKTREQARGGGTGPKPKLPALVIFLALLALLVGYRYLSGSFP